MINKTICFIIVLAALISCNGRNDFCITDQDQTYNYNIYDFDNKNVGTVMIIIYTEENDIQKQHPKGTFLGTIHIGIDIDSEERYDYCGSLYKTITTIDNKLIIINKLDFLITLDRYAEIGTLRLENDKLKNKNYILKLINKEPQQVNTPDRATRGR